MLKAGAFLFHGERFPFISVVNKSLAFSILGEPTGKRKGVLIGDSRDRVGDLYTTTTM